MMKIPTGKPDDDLFFFACQFCGHHFFIEADRDEHERYCDQRCSKC